MLDRPINQIKALAKSPGHNGIVYIEYKWQQLRLSMKWYEEQCVLVGFDEEQIAREIELQRIQGNALSPFRRADLIYMTKHRREPIERLDLMDNMQYIDVYEKLNRNYPYILAIDPAEGLSGDNYAFTLINPYTLAAAAEFQSKYISQSDMVKIVEQFLDGYCPKSLIVPESNKGYETINRLLESKYRYQLYYDDKKLLEAQNAKANEYGELQRASLERRAYGFSTTPSSRPKLFAILENFVEERRDILYTRYIVDDITGLIRKTSGKIEAGQGKHDDNIMSYLIGLAVYLHSAPEHLEQWGIRRGAMAPAEMDDPNSPEVLKRSMKDLIPHLRGEMLELFKGALAETDPVQESQKYYEELRRAQAMQPSFTPTRDRGAVTDPEIYRQTVDPSDQAFWQGYDRQIVDSNFERQYDVNLDDFLGES